MGWLGAPAPSSTVPHSLMASAGVVSSQSSSGEELLPSSHRWWDSVAHGLLVRGPDLLAVGQRPPSVPRHMGPFIRSSQHSSWLHQRWGWGTFSTPLPTPAGDTPFIVHKRDTK